MAIRPVFDPAMPADVRGALASLGERLRPDSRQPYDPPGWGRRAGRDAVRAVGLGAVSGVLPVVLAGTRMFGWAGKTAAVGAQVVLAAVWFVLFRFTGTLWAAFIVSAAVQLACMGTAFVLMDAWQQRRNFRSGHGHYLVGDDFDPESGALLARAQAAIAAVAGSATAAAGLLDETANNVVLSRQEWEIARALARRPGGAGGNPALVARRVDALERYAEQVKEADAALAERQAAGGPDGAPDAAELAEIHELAENARRVADAIRAAPGPSGAADAGSAQPRPDEG